MYNKIADWLDNVLNRDIPENVVAFCFNLYDDGDEMWSMELIGAGQFDPEDDDWACDEITDFDTRAVPFSWKETAEWDEVLAEMGAVLKEYLSNGKNADILKSGAGVGIGFVDGDIEILY